MGNVKSLSEHQNSEMVQGAEYLLAAVKAGQVGALAIVTVSTQGAGGRAVLLGPKATEQSLATLSFQLDVSKALVMRDYLEAVIDAEDEE